MNHRARTLPAFLGSMRLAVTLLAALAVASVAGTVLQQNQPYNDYLAKFGPYWFRVYESLGLFDVYHAPWFLAVLAFLVLSVSVCVSRNAPNIARRMLRGLRGQQRRLGYLSAHIGVVVVAVGGLVDGNLPLLAAKWRGEVAAETRNLPLSEVPGRSFLPAGNPAYRGRVNIPEGAKSNAVFVNMGDGYLVQPLPFTVELTDFRVRHYDTGQPKSFESDLLIHDSDLQAPLARTIRVNHPLAHKGVTIYQASFSDGGSSLSMRVWPLRAGADQRTVHSAVGKTLSLTSALRLELDDFRLFNVVNRAAADVKQADLRNVGPSFQFRLRRADGSAAEFHNYMLPVTVDDRRYYLSGVRESPADEFHYLHIPADAEGGIARFARLAALLHDADVRNAVADQISATALQLQDAAAADSRRAITEKTRQLFTTFANHGLAAVQEQLAQEAPPQQADNLLAAYFNILRLGVAELYRRALAAEGEGEGAAPAADFADHFAALAALGRYPAPLYLQLQSFDQVQASGLEVTRSPGQPLVYAGCALLVAGIFLMLFTGRRPPSTGPPSQPSAPPGAETAR